MRRGLEPQLSTMWLTKRSPLRGMWPRQPHPDARCFVCSEPVFFQILSTMARRPRSSRAWHFVLSAAHRDADARAMALAGTTTWGYDSDGQVGGYCWTKVWRPLCKKPPRTGDSRTLLLTLGLPWLRIHMALG